MIKEGFQGTTEGFFLDGVEKKVICDSLKRCIIANKVALEMQTNNNAVQSMLYTNKMLTELQKGYDTNECESHFQSTIESPVEADTGNRKETA